MFVFLRLALKMMVQLVRYIFSFYNYDHDDVDVNENDSGSLFFPTDTTNGQSYMDAKIVYVRNDSDQ